MTLYDFATRFVGMKEIAGESDNGFITWSHSLCGLGNDQHDEVPWCSSWLNALAWMLRLPRSKSAAARSWLEVGVPVLFPGGPSVGYDVVILKRGIGIQPGPEVTRGAPGHVGLYAGIEGDHVIVLGGNQGNAVSLHRFQMKNVLGVRRLRDQNGKVF
jgi:uncharacterized protein (TIGR02594 family)